MQWTLRISTCLQYEPSGCCVRSEPSTGFRVSLLMFHPTALQPANQTDSTSNVRHHRSLAICWWRLLSSCMYIGIRYSLVIISSNGIIIAIQMCIKLGGNVSSVFSWAKQDVCSSQYCLLHSSARHHNRNFRVQNLTELSRALFLIVPIFCYVWNFFFLLMVPWGNNVQTVRLNKRALCIIWYLIIGKIKILSIKLIL